MPRKKPKQQLIEELKTKIRGGHKQGWNPNLELWQRELEEMYGIKTQWVWNEISTPVGIERERIPVFKETRKASLEG